ncbi:MAG: exodeoxyribonuclease VII small subunit [Chlamydiae bacterium]|nr:exodeoxyribonuclease VII small subunit [Chlamydiota bacterium]MBI3276147.1 exodeoxyribonuclease VII small subunit [Chlamydiota bacterium]
MEKLESIVALLESDEVNLDEALKRYEEGIKLIRFCTKKLEEAEKKIEILAKNEEGKIVKKSFTEIKKKEEPKEELLF